MLGTVGGGGATFIDVRSPEEYRGEKLAPDHLPQEQAQVPGHIPGAANVPWSKAANDDGSFRSAEELTELYGGAGVTAGPGRPSRTAGSASGRPTRGSSFTSCSATRTCKNYDGSWTEYGSLVGVPVELGG